MNVEKKNRIDAVLTASQKRLSTARSIRAVSDRAEEHGYADRSSVIEAAAHTQARTSTAIWNLLAALHVREILLPNLEDWEVLSISRTKLTAARVLLREQPERHDAIAAAVRDPAVTTRSLRSRVERLSR
jgi:hypothetical protein